ncbi:MAG TPA: hypothetical protein VKK79_02775 [Candidatus Lokiarchaeia archaeon]|nr:hypothetical protein [Candidatus Lokiarchaeia archaeon]
MPPDEEEVGLNGDGQEGAEKSPTPTFFSVLRQRVKDGFQKLVQKRDAGAKSKPSPIVAFRQLICAKVHGESREEFISVLQALGFKNITMWEFTGKRRASLMFSRTLPNNLRIHLRLYDVGPMLYVLAHREPRPTADMKFHLSGFLRRLKGLQKTDHTTDDPRDVEIQEEFRTELADYEAGGDIFKEILGTVPNFAKKVDFEITDEDLRLFNAKYGDIDHIPVLTLLLENFLEAAETGFVETGGVLRSLPKMLEILGFQVKDGMPPDAETLEYQAKAIYAEKFYTILVGIEKQESSDIAQFHQKAEQIGAKYALLIAADENFASQIENAAVEQQVNVLSASEFGMFFLDHGDYPFTQAEIESLFRPEGGVIPLSRVNKLIQDKKAFERIFAQCQKVLDILQNAGIWVSLKEIERRAMEMVDLPNERIQNILSFLANPLIGLAAQKGKSYKATLNREEVQLKLKKLEDFIKDLRPTQTIL